MVGRYGIKAALFSNLIWLLLGTWTPGNVHANTQLQRFTVVGSDPTPAPAPPPSTPTLIRPAATSTGKSPGAQPLGIGVLGDLDPTQQYSDLIRAQSTVGPLDSGLLGESVDYYTGQTDFVATDVSLPWNGSMPMAVSRRFHVTNQAGGVLQGAFGDWDFDLPRVEGVVATSVGWTVDNSKPLTRCSDFSAPPAATVTTSTGSGNVTTSIPASEYATGYSLVIPGQGRRELLLRASDNPSAPGSNYPVVTHDWWTATCNTRYGVQPGTPDEGFQVTSPQGVTYSFIYYSFRPYPDYNRIADTSQPGVTATLPREQVFMLPDTITDRFGNWLQYHYNQNAVTGALSLASIVSSDGHTISVGYNPQGLVSSISDNNGHTWSYAYTAGSLSQVTLPDASYWSIGFADLDSASWTYTNATCTTLPTPTYGGSLSSSGTVSGTIQHPSGASGTFTFTVTRHGRNGAPGTCLTNSVGSAFAAVQPSVYDVLSLTGKTITGPNLPSPLTWTLAYAGCSSNSCNATTTAKVTDARGYDTLYTFGAAYSATASADTEGQLQSVERGGSGGANYLETDAYTYFGNCGSTCPATMGTPTQSRGDLAPLSTLKPTQSRTITRDGATCTQTMSNPDAYGFPQTITRTGTDTKTDTLTYQHDTGLWVIGTLTQRQSAGFTEVNIGLNSEDLPQTVTRFGRQDRSYTYYGSGNLQTMTDGDNHTTTYSNYVAGIPENVSYPDNTSESAVVSYNGKITSWTDANGYTTQYDHDAMGRLKQITYPSNTFEGYAPRYITWTTVASGWTRTETAGNYTKTTRYDALLRPVLVNEDSTRYVNRSYDADGRVLFESYPATSAGATAGITSVYDGIGRLSKQTDAGGYTTTYTPAANQLAVKDRDGNTTTYHYKAYDEPSTAWPVTIDTPVATTVIHRDTWGKPTSIVRGNVTRTRGYDSHQLLQTMTDPERNDTISFDHDGAGNLWHVYRQGAPSETRQYDTRNRLTNITYNNGDPAVVSNYWPDGLLKSSARGGVTHTYAYNLRRLVNAETVTTAQGTSYALAFGYDNLAHVSSITYPDNTAIDLSPDALGQPQQIGAYATNLSFYANGTAHEFEYGNGIYHTLNQSTDGRQLPGQSIDVGVFSWSYQYDGNAQPKQLIDNTGHATRTLYYDGVNRLHEADAGGLWGDTVFDYDDTDSLTEEQTGSTTTNYTIAYPSNRLTQVQTGSQTTALGYDDVGNVTQIGSGASATGLTFDTANLLTQVTQGGATYAYSYDGTGTRVSSTSASNLAAGVQTDSVYDHAGRLLYEATTLGANPDRIFANGFDTPANAQTTTKYIYLGNHLIAKDTKNGSTDTVIYVHTDALGSPVATTDKNRAILGTTTYLPYGGLYTSTGTGNQAGINYAGQYADATGLVYMHARYYDPQIRRFVSFDPQDVDPATALNFNRYSYAANSPYANYDPSGRCATSDVPNTDGSTPDDGQPCPGQADSSILSDASNALDSLNQAAMAMGPVGAEIGGAEGVATSALGELDAGVTALEEFTGATESVAYGPMNPGPLAEDVANTFRSGTYSAETLSSDTTLYRVTSDEGNPLGSFWTSVEPQGPLQSVIDFGLDQNWGNTATQIYTASVPAGTTIYEGAAAAQSGLVGGGNQIYIPWVDPTWLIQ